MGVKLAFILRKQLRQRVFKNRVLRKIFRRKRDEMTGYIKRIFKFCPTHQIPLR
jgi:hypothetical protein